LSKGFRQRVGIAQAILHRPKLLILDEPTNGLDPTQIVEVRRLIKELAHTSTVLLSTHILSEVEATCSRAVIIMNGKVRADARLEELSDSSSAILTLASEDADSNEIVSELKKLSGVKDVAVRPSDNGRVSIEIHTDSRQDICPEIFRLAARHDWPVAELRHSQRTLETVFNELAREGETR
jgi:ABC-2 type transport system ATP-binding protein